MDNRVKVIWAGLALSLVLLQACMMPTLGRVSSASLKMAIHVDGLAATGGRSLASTGPTSRLLLPSASSIVVTLTPADLAQTPVSQSTKVGASTVFMTFRNLVVGKYTVQAKALDEAGATLFAATSPLDFSGEYSLSLFLTPTASKELAKTAGGQRVTGTLAKGGFSSWTVPEAALTKNSFGLWVKDDKDLKIFAQYASGETFLEGASTGAVTTTILPKSAAGSFLTLYSAAGGTFEFVLNPIYLSYDGNGKDSGEVPADTTGYVTGDIVTVMAAADLAKVNHLFVGWNSASDGTGTLYAPGSTLTMGSTSIVLYAKWSSDPSVTFDKNDAGASGTMSPQTITLNSKANLTANGFTKTGWSFAGWATTPDGDVAYADGASFSISAANVTLYAKWTSNSYAVTFDSQGGSAVADASAAYGAKLTAPTDPTKAGYLFAGWYTDTAGTTAWIFSTDTITAATTLYAKWSLNSYAVTFDSQGGSAVASLNSSSGATIAAPTAPTLAGKNFAGWYKDAACTLACDFTNDKVTANTTLYALWTTIAPTGAITISLANPSDSTLAITGGTPTVSRSAALAGLAGGSLTITVSDASYASYQWSILGPVLSVSDNPTLSLVGNPYTVKITPISLTPLAVFNITLFFGSTADGLPQYSKSFNIQVVE
ncbi:MAG: InlB B-repeat-containing protein [Spirochaetota bacterium]